MRLLDAWKTISEASENLATHEEEMNELCQYALSAGLTRRPTNTSEAVSVYVEDVRFRCAVSLLTLGSTAYLSIVLTQVAKDRSPRKPSDLRGKDPLEGESLKGGGREVVVLTREDDLQHRRRPLPAPRRPLPRASSEDIPTS